MALITWHTKQMASDESDWVAHTYSVMGALDVTLLRLVEVVTAARAYALTGQDDLLAQYESARDLLAGDQANTRHLTADNTLQQRRLDVGDRQIEATLRVAKGIVEEHPQGHSGLSASEVLETEALVAAVRSTTEEMLAEEKQLLKQRSLKTAAQRGLTSLTMIAGFLVGTGFLVLAKIAVSREIKVSSQARAKVAERTAELVVANEELEGFSYSVSHDLRAPLRHIGGFSKLLIEEFGPSLDPVAREYVDRIQAGAYKMGVLVDELLNLARVGRHALNVRPCKLNTLVIEILSILKPDVNGREVEWRIADLPVAECDPVLVKQVFQNLLANAIKFTRPRPRALIEVGYKYEEGQTVFMVRDNGVGFNMKYVDKLFGVFQRLHTVDQFEGTGIGLVTVQRIVRKHGGSVWAEGEADKGAAFYFTLSGVKRIESKTNAMAAGG
jgi:signal transduction histidine kinase